MVENPEYSSRFESQDTLIVCQRVMVGCIILYDQIHPVGAFSKTNNAIDIRACVRALRSHQKDEVDGLLNALRYTTKHLNDDETPKATKDLLK